MVRTDAALPRECARYAGEARRATDDGFIWPVDRPAMLAPRAVAERMAEDLLDLRRDGAAPQVEAWTLQELGWTKTQLDLYAAAALRALGDGAAGEGEAA